VKRLIGGQDLVYGVGIENTIIGGCLRGGEELNEYDLTGHRQQWQADLDRVTDSGAGAFRYGLPWHEVNPAAGVYNWEAADRVMAYIAESVPARLVLDLVHYGTPTWLEGSFVDPAFPTALADYAGQLARRYGDLVTAYTPLNEPLVLASFGGLRGIWPPYLSGDEGWAQLVVSVAQGVQRATAILRELAPDAEVVHVEAIQAYTTEDATLEAEVEEWSRRKRLPLRLVLGQVGRGDWEWEWLVAHGAHPNALEQLAADGARPDLLGLNYYPELSCRELVRLGDKIVHVAVDAGMPGLERELYSASAEFSLPLMVTETAVEGGAAKKARWVDELVAGVQGLRAEGVPVVGVTWWPLFDFVDWSWASGGAVVEEFYRRDADGEPPRPVDPPGAPGGPIEPFLRRMGLYELGPGVDGPLTRLATPALERFALHAGRVPLDRTAGAGSIGD
jgi:beta-glucosidase/6-phospho-beta-glucosidase/beta-galactosidase